MYMNHGLVGQQRPPRHLEAACISRFQYLTTIRSKMLTRLSERLIVSQRAVSGHGEHSRECSWLTSGGGAPPALSGRPPLPLHHTSRLIAEDNVDAPVVSQF
jgi:hypothetical protein